jgi:hypothetical protein
MRIIMVYFYTMMRDADDGQFRHHGSPEIHDKAIFSIAIWSQKVTRFTLLIWQHVSDTGDI